jgi:hypothetical protein
MIWGRLRLRVFSAALPWQCLGRLALHVSLVAAAPTRIAEHRDRHAAASRALGIDRVRVH